MTLCMKEEIIKASCYVKNLLEQIFFFLNSISVLLQFDIVL